MNNNQIKLYLEIRTFPDNGIGIFNYTQDKPLSDIPQKIEIKDDCFLLKNKNNQNIYIKKDLNDYDPDKDYILFRIRKSFINNDFEIIKPIRIDNHLKYLNDLNYNAWYVIKSEPIFFQNNNEEYILNENDIIKFGNKAYEIIQKKVNITKNDLIKNNYDISDINKKVGSIFDNKLKSSQFKIQENETNQNKVCKECEKDSFTTEDPLLNLCSCNNFIHYTCLKKNLKTKLKDPETKDNQKKSVKKYYHPQFNCIKCHTPYPLQFKIDINEGDNKYELYSLIDFEKDIPEESDYIILESLNFIRNENKNEKTLFIVKLVNKQNITIGSRNADIIDDIGLISKSHAIIKYDNGNVIISNKSQSYGTFVLIKGNIKMKKEEINFQIGNSYITAKVKEYKKIST